MIVPIAVMAGGAFVILIGAALYRVRNRFFLGSVIMFIGFGLMIWSLTLTPH